jgi:hypothetical protein
MDLLVIVFIKPAASWIAIRCSRYTTQFRSCSVWRLPLRRAPALKLPSHEPGKWGHHDKPAQSALHGPLKPSNADTLFAKSSIRRLAAAPSPATGPGYPQPPRPCFDSGPIPPRARRVASRNHNLAPARPSPRRGPIFQSTTRFGMTGWVGDPTTGSPDLPSPPVGGPLPLVQPGRPLRGSPLCPGNRFCPV